MRLDIIEVRDNYMEYMEKYRKEGRRIYFQHETWEFRNMACTKVCNVLQKKQLLSVLQPNPDRKNALYCVM